MLSLLSGVLPDIQRLAQPAWLLLILLIPLALVLAAWLNAEWKDGVQYPHFLIADRLARVSGQRWYYLPWLLRCLALAALALALAQPQGLSQKVESRLYGQDVILVLDVSESMNADDLQPSRLAVAKDVLDRFIRQRPYDRIGLVLLAGTAFTAVPLTQDHASLLRSLRAVKTSMIRLEGTALGDGLLVAVNRMLESRPKSGRQGTVPGQPSTAPAGIIILATDGNNTSGFDPLQAAGVAADKNLRVYAVGLGGSAPALRKAGTGADGEARPLRDEAGRPVYWRPPDQATLAELARIGRGQCFRAEDQSQLAAVFKEIDRKEKTRITFTRRTLFREYYAWPLALALLLTVLERLLLRTRFLVFG